MLSLVDSSTSPTRLRFAVLVEEIIERDGRLDLLLNNAGISIGGPTHEFTEAHWNRIIDVNFRGVVNGVTAAYPLMIEQGWGHIVNTASGTGLVSLPFVAAYSATKHAVVGLSTALRPEAARYGVRVSVLCPGGGRNTNPGQRTPTRSPAWSVSCGDASGVPDRCPSEADARR